MQYVPLPTPQAFTCPGCGLGTDEPAANCVACGALMEVVPSPAGRNWALISLLLGTAIFLAAIGLCLVVLGLQEPKNSDAGPGCLLVGIGFWPFAGIFGFFSHRVYRRP